MELLYFYYYEESFYYTSFPYNDFYIDCGAFRPEFFQGYPITEQKDERTGCYSFTAAAFSAGI